MDETLLLIRKYVRMVWCYRWIALIGAVLMCIPGWFVVLQMPDEYRVETKVFLDTNTMLKPVLRGLAVDGHNRAETVSMVRQTLLTRPNLEAIARKTDLDLEAKSPNQFERVLNSLERNISVRGTRREDIFEISYRHSDPKRATRVVEALLNLFVETALGANRKDTTSTKQFVAEQIQEYRKKLEAAEDRLKEFKQRNVGLLPGEGRDYYTQMQSVSAHLAEAELRLQEAVNRRDELKRQLAGEEPSFGFDPTLSAATSERTEFDDRISTLEARLDELLLQYTERHPDVIGTRRILDDLKRQRKERLAQVTREQSDVPLAAENPIYQQMKVAQGQAEAEVAALRARVDEYKRRKDQLERLVDTVPRIEAELTRLNRDYGIYKANYDALVERREALQISDDASQTTDSVQFNVVEPPREPVLPIGPDRAFLNAGVLGVGLGGGVVLAWLAAMLRPAVYTKNELSELTDLPVLGVVSRIWTREMRFKRRFEVASFVVGCVCLMGLFAGVYAVDLLGIDAASRLNELGLGLDRLGRILP